MAKPSLNVFSQAPAKGKTQSISFLNPDLCDPIKDFVKSKVTIEQAEATLEEAKKKLREFALSEYAKHNATAAVHVGNIMLASEEAELRVNFNNGYKASLTDEAIAELEAHTGKKLAHLFVKTEVAVVDFAKIKAKAAFMKDFIELCKKHDATDAVTAKTGNVAVKDFNQQAARVLTPDELVELDSVIAVPTTVTVVSSDLKTTTEE